MTMYRFDSAPAASSPLRSPAAAVSPWREGLSLLRPLTYSSRLTPRGFWIFQGFFWAFSILSLTAMLRTFYALPDVYSIILGRISTGFVLTCLLYRCYRWMHRRHLGWKAALLWLCFFNMAAAAAGTVFWGALLQRGFAELPSASPLASLLLARIIALITWNVAFFAVEFILAFHAARMEASEAKLAAQASELKQLQSQLNPHFLFNALNTIIVSAGATGTAREVTQNLADYLRFSLHEARLLEPLGRELDALESYLELQRVRFQEGLECSLVASPAARRVMVPPMVIQPLLENAFKFGRRSSEAPMQLRVSALVEDHFLTVEVANSGAWVPPGSSDSPGSGLTNLRRRLHLLLGEEASLEVQRGAEEVIVTIRLPAETVSSAQAT